MAKRTQRQTTVDAELFPSLVDAIRFVAERGGGEVRTELAGSTFAQALELPEGVTLVPVVRNTG